MRYIIIGAGGMGGVISGFLAAGGKDVAIIARGAHLAAIQQEGLTLKSAIKGELCLKNIGAYAATDNFEPGDVVFVCVKGYSLMETVPIIAKAARENAVVIPILNSLNAGSKLQKELPQLTVLDGCIYTSAFISAPGIISHPGTFLRVIFGPRAGQEADEAKLKQIAADLRECAIEPTLSSCIEADMFKKLAFISTFAATDSFFDVNTGAIRQEGEPREMMKALLRELVAIAEARGMSPEEDLFTATMKTLDKTPPEITSSMHKDVLAGKSFEKQELIFDMVELAEELGVDVPCYLRVARHFGYDK